jgi:hypothetical protein
MTAESGCEGWLAPAQRLRSNGVLRRHKEIEGQFLNQNSVDLEIQSLLTYEASRGTGFEPRVGKEAEYDF